MKVERQYPETIIFFHGSGPGASANANWKDILPQYEEQFHVVASDLVGFGDTDHPVTVSRKWCRVDELAP